MLFYFAYLIHLIVLIKSSMANSKAGVRTARASRQRKYIEGNIWENGRRTKNKERRMVGPRFQATEPVTE